MISPETVSVLGVEVAIVDMAMAVKTVCSFLGRGFCHHVVTANAELVVQAQSDPELLKILHRADLIVPDGAGILWAAGIFGVPLPGRVPGIDLTGELLKVAARESISVFLLGAAPGVAEKAACRMQKLYPGINIVGTQHGFFPPSASQQVVEAVNKSGADILLVAMGVPRQEKWIAAHRSSLQCSVAMGVGGTLDVYAGICRRAPRWMGELGLEWLFRLIQQPRRFWRMLALPQFVFQVLYEKWSGGYRK